MPDGVEFVFQRGEFLLELAVQALQFLLVAVGDVAGARW